VDLGESVIFEKNPCAYSLFYIKEELEVFDLRPSDNMGLQEFANGDLWRMVEEICSALKAKI